MSGIFRGFIPLFATSVVFDARRSLAIDLKAVGANFVECRASQSRWFAVASAVDTLHSFLAPRMITTLVAALAIWVTIAALV